MSDITNSCQCDEIQGKDWKIAHSKMTLCQMINASDNPQPKFPKYNRT